MAGACIAGRGGQTWQGDVRGGGVCGRGVCVAGETATALHRTVHILLQCILVYIDKQQRMF